MCTFFSIGCMREKAKWRRMWEALLPFAYVFNKFEIFSGMTICSEQYILDKTISIVFSISYSTSFLAWDLCVPFLDDLQLNISGSFGKKSSEICTKALNTKTSFGWRQSFLFSSNENFYTKTLKKSFSYILWLLWFPYDCGIKIQT